MSCINQTSIGRAKLAGKHGGQAASLLSLDLVLSNRDAGAGQYDVELAYAEGGLSIALDSFFGS